MRPLLKRKSRLNFSYFDLCSSVIPNSPTLLSSDDELATICFKKSSIWSISSFVIWSSSDSLALISDFDSSYIDLMVEESCFFDEKIPHRPPELFYSFNYFCAFSFAKSFWILFFIIMASQLWRSIMSFASYTCLIRYYSSVDSFL